METQILQGDCLHILPTLADCSVDSIVTDPPYELGFMGKSWDATGIAYSVELWRECLRVLKPGGHLLAFGGSRTYHRLAVAVEDAGFEIRDQIQWIYGSGFPKSLDVSKAIDRQRDDSGRVRAVCRWLNIQRKAAGVTHNEIRRALRLNSPGSVVSILSDNERSHPRCPTMEQWEKLRAVIGFGGEFDGEVEELNRRKGTLGDDWQARSVTGHAGGMWDKWEKAYRGFSTSPNGRTGERRDEPETPEAKKWNGWGTSLKPAHEPIVMARKPFDGTVADNVKKHGTGAIHIKKCEVDGRFPANVIHDDSGEVKDLLGDAARFFYSPKSSGSDRGAGNNHPTVKPTELMQYLCRLVTPPGGVILDPFCGSGTTVKAALIERFRCIGIELNAEYIDIAQKRLSQVQTKLFV